MENNIFKLWPGDAPGHQEGFEVPTIEYYAPKCRKGRGAVVIFAGGAYRLRTRYEGQGYAEFLAENGIAAFEVTYRVKPTRFPYPILDARRAVRFVRANAERFGIDPEKIAVMGSSAGGHLAATVSTYKENISGEGADEIDNFSPFPNAQILCYPVLDIASNPGSYLNLLDEGLAAHKRVTPYYIADRDTPPVFLWHTATDPAVDVVCSYRYATRLRELNVPVEMHIFPLGGHGLGLGYHPEKNIDEPYVTSWTGNLISWLKLQKFIDAE